MSAGTRQRRARLVHLTPLVAAIGVAACGDRHRDEAPQGTTSRGETPTTPAPDTTPGDHGVAFAGDPLRTDRRPDGLVVETFREGDGPALERGQTGVIDFEMRLGDGRVIDSSAKRKAALRVPLSEGSAIPGLLQGLEGMRVGEGRRLRVPSALAYGDVGRPPIPPRADLVIDVVLLEIQK